MKTLSQNLMRIQWILVYLLSCTASGGAFAHSCDSEVVFDIDTTGVELTNTETLQTLINKGAPSIRVGTTAFYYGFDRITAQDVNPIIYKVVDNAVVWVRDDYETSSDDSITSGLVWDGDARLYATFTASSLLATGFPTGSGWLPVLATTGALVQANAKVSVLVQIDPATGDALAGTFISSLLSTGKSNSMFPVMLDIGLSETGDTQVLFEGGSSFNPRETDTTRMTDTGGYNAPHPYRVLFNETLSVALAAEAIGYNNVTGLTLTAGEHICEGQGNKAVPAPLWATIVIAIGITTIVIGAGRQSRPFS